MNEYLGDLYGYIKTDVSDVPLNMKGVKLKISKPRNIKHHRLIFGMLNYTVNHMNPRPFVKNSYRLLTVFKDYAGYYDSFERSNGDIVKEYESFSFESMDEIKFKPVAEEIKDFCYNVLNMDGVSKDVIQGLLDIEF